MNGLKVLCFRFSFFHEFSPKYPIFKPDILALSQNNYHSKRLLSCDCDSEHAICNAHNRRSCVVYMSSSTFTQRLVVWYVITSDTKLLSTICFKEPQQGPYSCVVCLLFLRSGVYWWWFHCYVFHSFFPILA